MTEKKKTRVLSVLLVISLAAAVFFGVRAHQLSRQKDLLEFNTLNSQLCYIQYVLVTMEEGSLWNTGVSVLGTGPYDIYEVEDRGDNRELVEMVTAISYLVGGGHPNRTQIIDELKELRVARDTETMTFTILEGDAEAITELCQYPE